MGQDTQARHSWFSVLLSSLPDKQPHSLKNQSQSLHFVSRPSAISLCEPPVQLYAMDSDSVKYPPDPTCPISLSYSLGALDLVGNRHTNT